MILTIPPSQREAFDAGTVTQREGVWGVEGMVVRA